MTSSLIDDADTTTFINISLPLCCDVGTPETSRAVSTDLFIVVLLTIIGALSVVGNAAIVWIVVATPTLRATPHNRFVVQLAACDLMTSLLNAPPIIVSMVIGRWCLGETACRLNGASTTLFGVASVVTLAAISLNRCYVVAYTTRGYKMFTVQRTNLIIAVIWLISIICCVPPVFGWSRYEFRPGKAICTIRWSTSPSYTASVLSVGAFMPFIIMVASYIKIFKKVRETNQRIGASTTGAPFGADTYRQRSSNPADGLDSFAGIDRYNILALYSGSASVAGAVPQRTDSDPNTGYDLRRTNSGQQLKSSVERGTTCRTRRSASSGRHSDRMTVVFTMSAAGPREAPLWTTDDTMAPGKEQNGILNRSLSNIHDCSTVSIEAAFTTVQKSVVPPNVNDCINTFQPKPLPLSGTTTLTGWSPTKVVASPISIFSQKCNPQTSKEQTFCVSSLSRPTPAWSCDDQITTTATTYLENAQPPISSPRGSPKPVLPEHADRETPLNCRSTTVSEPSIKLFHGANAASYRRWSATSLRFSIPPSTTMTSLTGNPVDTKHSIERQSTCGQLGVRRVSASSAGGGTVLVAGAPFTKPLGKKKVLQRSSRRSRFRDEIKLSLAMFVVVVVFVASWVPISLVNLVETLGFEDLIVTSVDHGAVAMMFLQPAVNPIVYGAMNRNFRERFYDIVRVCLGRAIKPTSGLQRSVGNTC